MNYVIVPNQDGSARLMELKGRCAMPIALFQTPELADRVAVLLERHGLTDVQLEQLPGLGGSTPGS